jgi:hypothetical protein
VCAIRNSPEQGQVETDPNWPNLHPLWSLLRGHEVQFVFETLGCAQAGHAGAVITGDDDLLSLRSFQGIEIISAAEFQRRWQAGMVPL